ncbi:MAG TPA: hypothetical protein ENI80_02445 [Acidiferrobacteraceae bacterium]|nr:hypothetical protein [Acidiferrobacteraceae bacterium]
MDKKSKISSRFETQLGTKATVAKTKDSNLLIGALAFDKNRYDGHTLPDVFSQIGRILGHVPKICLGDRGYRGKNKVNNTRIHIPKLPRKNASKALQTQMRKRFQRRAAIEPVIGHLKSDHRLNRNHLKGTFINPLSLRETTAWTQEVEQRRSSCRGLG